MKLDKKVIEELKSPIVTTWNCIASDCDFVENNMDALEMCIDANRLATFADASADALIHNLCVEHGYANVLDFLDKHIKIY
jgi:hypothetical protein